MRLSEPLRDLPDSGPAILATGGFGASRELLREHVTPEADHVLLRAAPGSTGDGLRLGLEAGAADERRPGRGLRSRDAGTARPRRARRLRARSRSCTRATRR